MEDLYGRKIVTIPISKEDFYKNPAKAIAKHLDTIESTHQSNVREIEFLHDYYKGKHSILTEKQRYNGSDINNVNIENHAHKIVDFKVGFMYGKPLDYSVENASESNDDMTMLNKYLKVVNKASLDIEKAQDLYEFGISHQLLLPKRTSEVEDINEDAPFVLSRIDSTECCVVYSSDIPRQKLFGVVFSKAYDENGTEKQLYNIFMPKRKMLFDSDKKKVGDKPQPYNYIPLIEYTINNVRMGLIELVYSLQELIDKINSLQIDDIEENVNSYMIVKNQQIDDEWLETFKEFKKQRVMLLTTNNPETPADLELLDAELKQEAINLFYERVVKALYDIASVPQSSGNVTSGGDTGQARLLGNGWESSQNQAQVDQTYLLQYELELIKYILRICKNYPGCPIETISVGDINVKFNINMSDNLLVKSQSLQNLHAINFPLKQALAICGITNDVDGIGNLWEQNNQKAKEQTNNVQNNMNKNSGVE